MTQQLAEAKEEEKARNIQNVNGNKNNSTNVRTTSLSSNNTINKSNQRQLPQSICVGKTKLFQGNNRPLQFENGNDENCLGDNTMMSFNDFPIDPSVLTSLSKKRKVDNTVR